MGVDYYTCQACSHNFPDCGHYFTCGTCENMFCDEECGKKEYVLDEDGCEQENEWGGELTSCILCREEVATDSDLLRVILGHFKIDREQAMEIYRNFEDEKDA